MPSDPDDLETIVQLLEMAAIELSPRRDSTFSFDQLFDEAQRYAGPGLALNKNSVQIVVRSSGFLRKGPGGLLSLR